MSRRREIKPKTAAKSSNRAHATRDFVIESVVHTRLDCAFAATSTTYPSTVADHESKFSWRTRHAVGRIDGLAFKGYVSPSPRAGFVRSRCVASRSFLSSLRPSGMSNASNLWCVTTCGVTFLRCVRRLGYSRRNRPMKAVRLHLRVRPNALCGFGPVSVNRDFRQSIGRRHARRCEFNNHA